MVSKKTLTSNQRSFDIAKIDEETLIKKRIIHEVNSILATKRKMVMVELIKNQLLENQGLDVPYHSIRQILSKDMRLKWKKVIIKTSTSIAKSTS